MAKTATDTALRECICPHTSNEEGGHISVVRMGTRWRPDDERVRRNPQFFESVETPTNERAHWSDFTRSGTQTEAPERRPDGWRRDWHGPRPR